MPLPDYSPRSDSFGNWYYGGFQVDSAVEAGYGAGTALTHTQAGFNAFLDSALGASNWATSAGIYYFRFPVPYEPISTPVTTTNYRFSWTNTGTSFAQGYYLNTSYTTPVGLIHVVNSFTSNLHGGPVFATINEQGMWFVKATAGSPGTLTTSISAAYMGWVKDPVFPLNTTERIRNATGGTTIFNVTGVVGSTSLVNTCYANSVITCNVVTPGANVTDLCILDSVNNYLNIGSIPNSIFYPGTGLTVGQIYRIPPAQDPDGNTEQNVWLCIGTVSGWNGSTQVANAGFRLIRVWSNNIT